MQPLLMLAGIQGLLVGNGIGIQSRCSTIKAGVQSLSSKTEFDKSLKDAGNSLVVIDYATSWCGPCKMMEPKYVEFSETYGDVPVHFYKVMGDDSEDSKKLLRSQGVRALPSFHLWKKGKQVEEISGAKTQALKDAIEKFMSK